MTCEQVGLDVPLYYGDSMEIMRVGAGQYQGSFIPGYGKTILLSGHNTTYSSPLQKIAVGDEVTIKTSLWDLPLPSARDEDLKRI